ncbi:exodeoxyribonuclease VIII [Kosakonia sacchari]|uniref:exodeoxyribonuclease VIII n=1 Tax=Kosakonia sacchari TaxID=1158459 RepID=UPI001584F0BE|nr:exodeoxyribonuclease VIII [Kosakonia sacchari]NUL36599.1 exodeoxyribonuclease VIII [Kosakonia sacchari]
MFSEDYPAADSDFYEYRVCEDEPGMPRPELDKWDENFLYENDWDEKENRPVPRAAEPELVDFDSLSSTMKIAVLVKYRSSLSDTDNITKDMLPAAFELTQDEANTFSGHIVEAICKTPAIAAMYPDRILEAISWVVAKCPETKKWPEIKAELSNWMKRHADDRNNGNVAPVEEKQRTPSGATAGGGNKTDRHPDLEHNFDVLALEVACGIIARAMDYDIYAIPQSILNRAKDIVKLKERPFPALYDAMRQSPGILDYSRAMIIFAVKTAPENIEQTPGALISYLNKTLVETDHANPDPKMVAVACGTEQQDENEENAETTPESVADDAENGAAPETDADAGETSEQAGPVNEERAGPFYYRNDAGAVGRANKMPKLQAALAEGCVEIDKEEYLARKNGTWSEPDEEKLAAQPEVKNLGGGVFTVEGLTGEQSKAEEKPASNEVEKEEVPAAGAAQPADFQSVGASIEEELSEKPEEALDNLGIWRQVMRTDPRFTKDMAGTGFEGTSINAEYMIMRATELFGPIGSRWGFEILEDRMLPGAPLSEAIYEDKKFIGNRMLRDADGTLLFEQNHSIKIRLWYQTETDEGSVYAYGATPYMYRTKHGIKCDGEAQKKSLTDAIKKGLSLLGFSADVWLGLYDMPEYQAENQTEFAIKNASDKAEDVTRLRNELDEKMTRVANTIEKAVNTNEAKKVFDTLAREVEVHRKAADAKGDAEHAKYLSSRLRRLSQIKDQRIKELTESQEQTA